MSCVELYFHRIGMVSPDCLCVVEWFICLKFSEEKTVESGVDISTVLSFL